MFRAVFLKFSIALTIFFGMITPAFVFAQEENVEPLYNPLAQTVSTDKPVQAIAAIVIRALFGIAGSAALLMFVIGGFMWLTAAGNEKRVQQGLDIFKWSTLGIIVMFSSYVIVGYLFDSFTKPVVVGGTSSPQMQQGGGGSFSSGGGPVATYQYCSMIGCTKVPDEQCLPGFGYATETACKQSVGCDTNGGFCKKNGTCPSAYLVNGAGISCAAGYVCCDQSYKPSSSSTTAKIGYQFCSNQNCAEVLDKDCQKGFGYQDIDVCKGAVKCDTSGKGFCAKGTTCKDPATPVPGISCSTGYSCCTPV